MNQNIGHTRYRNVSGGSIIINDINPNWELPDGGILDVSGFPNDLIGKSHDLRRLIAKNFLIPDQTSVRAEEIPPAAVASMTVSEEMMNDIADRVSNKLFAMLSEVMTEKRIPLTEAPSQKDVRSAYEDLLVEQRVEIAEEILKTKFPATESSISSTEAVEASENVTSGIKSSLRGLRKQGKR